MDRGPLEAGCLRPVGHDAARAVPEVEFTGGAVHRCRGVPAGVAADPLNAPGPGRCLNREIRGRCPYRPVSPSPPSRPSRRPSPPA